MPLYDRPWNTGTSTLNFGATPGTNSAEIVVTGQLGIETTSNVSVFMMDSTTATHNAAEHALVPIKLTAGTIIQGVGFTIQGWTEWRLNGTFEVRWTWTR